MFSYRSTRMALIGLGLLASLPMAGCANRIGEPLLGDARMAPTAKLAKIALDQPQNGAAQLAYGKALARDGQTEDAIRVLSSKAALATQDVSLYATLGSLYDQKGDFKTARGLYGQGFVRDRQNAALLNNYAMSFILEGRPAQAETILKAALTGRNKNDSRLRQNLALAVGLQGRFAEARQIASKDLPPEDVETNLAYLEKMLRGQDTWQQLRDAG